MNSIRVAGFLALLLASSASAQTARYVWTNSPSPAAPYTNWHTAARTLQAAVDVCEKGDIVWATNGVYSSGGRVAPGMALTNRVMVAGLVAVVSVNGPKVTTIRGAGPLGPAAVRCVYLTNDAVLSGFRLDNGHTLTAGGAGSEPDQHGGGLFAYNAGLVTNCLVVSNAAARQGGGIYAYGTAVDDCRMEHNEAEDGGGAYLYFSPLRNSEFLDNLASPGYGGGAYAVGDEVTDCTFTRNNGYWGGGLFLGGGQALRLVAVSNMAAAGGGITAAEAILSEIQLFHNTSYDKGGGAYLGQCWISDSVISNNNLAWQDGIGGAALGAGVAGMGSLMENCTLRDNWGFDADDQGGGLACLPAGTWTSQVVNCSVRGNSAGDGGGIFVATGALCVASATGTNATDIRQNAATNYGGGVCLTTQAVFRAAGRVFFADNLAANGGGLAARAGARVDAAPDVDGQAPAFTGNTATNSGGGLFAAEIDTLLALRDVRIGRDDSRIAGNLAYGDDAFSGGGGLALYGAARLLATNLDCAYNQATRGHGGALLLHNSQAALFSTAPASPATAMPRTLFLDNRAEAQNGGGIYAYASQLSVQHAAFLGNAAVRGGAVHLDSGSTSRLGNVVMAGNFAALAGGGLRVYRGGVADTVCDARHCTLYDNAPDGIALGGGGALSLTNGIVVGNGATNISPGCTVAHSDVQGGYAGAGNLDADPFFRDIPGYDFHLTAASTGSVVDAGVDAGLANDCVFRARPLGAGYDLGAFEYNRARDDSDGDTIPDGWELDHDLDPLNPADGPAHSDGDGIPNDDEYLADTDPQDSGDFFRLTDCAYNTNRPDRGIFVGFTSSSNRQYSLYCTAALSNDCIWTAVPGQIDQPGVGSYDGFNDTNAPAAYPARTYRVTAAPLPE